MLAFIRVIMLMVSLQSNRKTLRHTSKNIFGICQTTKFILVFSEYIKLIWNKMFTTNEINMSYSFKDFTNC